VTTPDGAQLTRELERVADRLRVLGPRLAVQRVRAVLQELADLAADAEGRPRRRVPELAPHSLGDQLLVLGHDVAGVGPQALAAAAASLVELRRTL
jgi:hypothetical protein